MFSRFFKTTYEWRRLAIYHPVDVAQSALGNEDGTLRQHILRTCQVGMRVVLHHSCEPDDPHGVALFVSDGRQIGCLPIPVADWVAPLLDSGKDAFDAEIWSLDKIAGQNGEEQIACRVTLTQHELVPVRQFAWTAWWRGAGSLRPRKNAPRPSEGEQ